MSTGYASTLLGGLCFSVYEHSGTDTRKFTQDERSLGLLKPRRTTTLHTQESERPDITR